MTYKEFYLLKQINKVVENPTLKKFVSEIGDEIEKNPRVCSKCGIVETRHNVILDYKDLGFLCDDCFTEIINLEEI